MKSFVFVFLFLIGLRGFSQEFRGTLISAIICEDAVVMASESRVSFVAYNDVLRKEIPYAYLDSVRKIFNIGHYKIGISGTPNLGNTYWEDILVRFNKKYSEELSGIQSVDSVFMLFNAYLSRSLHVPDSLIKSCGYLLAGYENKKPVILARFGTQETVKSYAPGEKIQTHYCYANNTVGPVVRRSDEAIKTWLYELKNCFWDEVNPGGPNEIIKLLKTGEAVTVKSFTAVRFKNYASFIKLVKKEKVPVKFLFPESRQLLLDIFNSPGKKLINY